MERFTTHSCLELLPSGLHTQWCLRVNLYVCMCVCANEREKDWYSNTENGSLGQGYIADVSLFDPHAYFSFNATLKHRCNTSPLTRPESRKTTKHNSVKPCCNRCLAAVVRKLSTHFRMSLHVCAWNAESQNASTSKIMQAIFFLIASATKIAECSVTHGQRVLHN